MKRAQLTIFIIVGMVLVILAAIIFSVADYYKPSTAGLQQRKEAAQMYVQGCLSSAIDESIREVAIQGGYCGVPHPLFYEAYLISYYRMNRTNLMPDRQQIEAEVSECAMAPLLECIASSELNANLNEATLETTMGSKLTARLHLPVVVESEGMQSMLTDFRAAVNLNALELYDASVSIIDAHNMEAVPLTRTNQITEDLGLGYELITPGDNNVIFALFDPAVSNPLIWAFAVRYDA